VIRVNSQSGKGGVAWVLEQDKGLKLPKRLQADFSRHVQALADETSRELNAADIWGAFQQRAMGKGGSVQAAAYVEARTEDGRTLFGVGIDSDVATASVRALLGAANAA
jgi:2-isopropylmalate synthase